MGTVYLAERVDGEVAQRVAVKLLRPGRGRPANCASAFWRSGRFWQLCLIPTSRDCWTPVIARMASRIW